MEDEFYATIKLISGEEIICKVCYMPEEDTCLVSEPMLVEHVSRRKADMNLFPYLIQSESWEDNFGSEIFMTGRNALQLKRDYFDNMRYKCKFTIIR